ncbi:MAG: hypothetical protein IAF02_08620 [Anaerolineae bacterium]|nr:hypothetical protein [Anaerolineae bacterium]
MALFTNLNKRKRPLPITLVTAVFTSRIQSFASYWSLKNSTLLERLCS